MTTGLTVSVTDELVEELEEEARGAFGHPDCGWFDAATFADYFVDAHYLSLVSPATIMSLLAERAELKRDAGRYRWLRSSNTGKQRRVFVDSVTTTELDAAIDDAMQSEAKP